MPFDEAVSGADALDCEPLPQPMPPRIKDAVLQVLSAVGVAAAPTSEMLIEGYYRNATERAVDLVAWMAMFV